MHKILLAIAFALSAVLSTLGAVAPTYAGQSCPKGQYFDGSKCAAKIRVTISNQDAAAASGAQWGPPNGPNCDRASREMDKSAKRCRQYDASKSFDAKLGIVVDGKTFEQCAKCCRQLREGMARWQLCFKLGLAPKPDYASARQSAERMNCGFTY